MKLSIGYVVVFGLFFSAEAMKKKNPHGPGEERGIVLKFEPATPMDTAMQNYRNEIGRSRDHKHLLATAFVLGLWQGLHSGSQAQMTNAQIMDNALKEVPKLSAGVADALRKVARATSNDGDVEAVSKECWDYLQFFK